MDGETAPCLVDIAQSLLSAGLCVIPADVRRKKPIGLWGEYQQRRSTAAEVTAWFARSHKAICIVCGTISGNLEMIDFDCHGEVFDSFSKLAEEEMPGLLGRLVIERSQSDGRHVVYRCDVAVPGNSKLAEKVCACADAESAVYAGKSYDAKPMGDYYEFYPTLVETRGEGGIFLCAPSPGYQLLQGSFLSIPVISERERDVLIRCARAFNECIEMAPQPKQPVTPGGDRPGDIFNERGDVRDVLASHGWTCARSNEKNEFWRRPGKSEGWSASYNGKVFYCFTSNAAAFELNTGYSNFQVYALLEHNGDYSAAARELRARGFGNSRPTLPAQPPTKAADLPTPLPLDDPRPPIMPDNLLPSWLGDMVRGIAEVTETPLELPALPCLSAIATAAQGKFSVRAEASYFEPLCIWTAPAMSSGQRKSAVLKFATAPLLSWEAEQRQSIASQRQMIDSQIKTEQARIAKLRAKCAAEEDPQERRVLQERIAESEAALPVLPVEPRVFTQDVTPEHLGTMMAEQSGWFAILSDEAGIFDILAGRYSNGVPNVDLFLQSHSGSAVRVDRGSRPPVMLDHPLLTLGLSPQPDVLKSMNNKPGFRGRGLLARFLYALPQSRMGYRTLQPRQILEHVSMAYADGIRRLLETQLRYDSIRNEYFPNVLVFEEDAYQMWKCYQRDIEIELRQDGRFAGMTDWAGKLSGATVRLAGLLHCAKYALAATGPVNAKIDADVTESAIKLAQVLAEHALLVFDLMADNGALEAARKAWRLIQSAGMMTFTYSQLWHPLRGTFKTADELEPAIELLLDHYLIVQLDEKTASRPGRRGRRFAVNSPATN